MRALPFPRGSHPRDYRKQNHRRNLTVGEIIGDKLTKERLTSKPSHPEKFSQVVSRVQKKLTYESES